MAATKFDGGTYKLAAEIWAEGSPAVVFSSGSGDAGEPWDAVISALRSSTTVVTYARAGTGESETPPDSTPRSVGAAADELHRLLVATGVPGPFVLVGHSLGALVALIFAAQRPQQLAGLVLVDATDIHLNLDIENPARSPPTATGPTTCRSTYSQASTKSHAAENAPSTHRPSSSPAASSAGSTWTTSSPGAPSAWRNSTNAGKTTTEPSPPT